VILSVMGNWLAGIWNWLVGMWQAALANPDAAQILLAASQTFLALLALLAPVAGWLLFRVIRRRQGLQQFTQSTLEDSLPFEKINPYTDGVLRRLLGERSQESVDDPLADYNIPYQQRVEGRNSRREMIDLMERADELDRRWVLVLGRSGLGKSREAAQVAKALNDEGWTVLKLKTLGWELLSRPDARILETLGDEKLLFFLDDVNRMIPLERGRVGTSGNDQQAKLADAHPLDRLLEFLERVEHTCREKNVRVIATGRNEPVPEKDGEPSELQKLGLDKFALWKRFAFYELPDPDVDALVDLQREGVERANLKANPTTFERLAQRSDRTMRVFVNNLREARRENLPLEAVSEENLQDTWKRLYQRATRQRSGTPHIYAAVILLRALGVELQPTIVLPTARRLASQGKPAIWGWRYHWQLQRALRYLTAIASTSILAPKDGQLEASPVAVEVGEKMPLVG